VHLLGHEGGKALLKRRETTVEGLDEILQGGLPVPSTVLVAGEPGAGKTTLAVQFLFGGAKKGENGLYVTGISEPQWLVQHFLAGFKWFDPRMVEEGRVVFADIGNAVREKSEEILPQIVSLVEAYSPKRLVIDPITPMVEALRRKGKEREFMHDLFSYLKSFEATTLITAELHASDITRSIEGYMADGIILLSYPEQDGVRRKYLEVIKMRGTRHHTGRHVMDITPEGVVVQSGLR
jgi:circadian clock protein KaiC